MTTMLHFDFPFNGPWGLTLASAMDELARDITNEEGLIFKIWTEDEWAGRAGGVYLFANQGLASRFRRKHLDRLGSFGIEDISVFGRNVNDRLSRVTKVQI